MRHILVPIQFAANDHQALHMAVQLLRGPQQGCITLLHVVPERDERLGFGTAAFELAAAEVDRKLRFLERLIPQEIEVQVMQLAGPIPQAIAYAAAREEADLILLTTEGRRHMRHYLPASVSEETLRLAACPVLVLHLNAKPAALAKQPA